LQCDQVKPICQRCERNDRLCTYPSEDAGSLQLEPRRPGKEPWSTRYLRIILDAPAGFDGPEHGTPRPNLLRHFGHAWRSIFNVPRFPVDFHRLDGTPYLHRTLLAIAASHLRHSTNEPTEHRVAEAWQQSVALSDFRKQLARPMSEMAPAEIDALVMTSMLMNMLIFALPSEEDQEPAKVGLPDPAKSWVFSSRDDRLGWLELLSGLKPLLVATRPYRKGTMLGPVLDKTDEWQRYQASQEHNLDQVPEAWLQLCHLPRHSKELDAADDLAYHAMDPQTQLVYLFWEPLRILAEIRTVEPLTANIFRYVEFIGKLEAEFRQLLFDCDEAALWMVGYWMGLMTRFEGIWWCDRRVKRDYVAIKQWFEYLQPASRSGTEGKMWEELLRDLRQAHEWPLSEDVNLPARSVGVAVMSPMFKSNADGPNLARS
jgi:hypothetical protein